MNPWLIVSVGLVVNRIRAGGITKFGKRLNIERRHVELISFTRNYKKKSWRNIAGDSERKMGGISAFETFGQGFTETDNGRGEGRDFEGNENARGFNSWLFWRRARVKNGGGMLKLMIEEQW